MRGFDVKQEPIHGFKRIVLECPSRTYMALLCPLVKVYVTDTR